MDVQKLQRNVFTLENGHLLQQTLPLVRSTLPQARQFHQKLQQVQDPESMDGRFWDRGRDNRSDITLFLINESED